MYGIYRYDTQHFNAVVCPRRKATPAPSPETNPPPTPGRGEKHTIDKCASNTRYDSYRMIDRTISNVRCDSIEWSTWIYRTFDDIISNVCRDSISNVRCDTSNFRYCCCCCCTRTSNKYIEKNDTISRTLGDLASRPLPASRMHAPLRASGPRSNPTTSKLR